MLPDRDAMRDAKMAERKQEMEDKAKARAEARRSGKDAADKVFKKKALLPPPRAQTMLSRRNSDNACPPLTQTNCSWAHKRPRHARALKPTIQGVMFSRI